MLGFLGFISSCLGCVLGLRWIVGMYYNLGIGYGLGF